MPQPGDMQMLAADFGGQRSEAWTSSSRGGGREASHDHPLHGRRDGADTTTEHDRTPCVGLANFPAGRLPVEEMLVEGNYTKRGYFHQLEQRFGIKSGRQNSSLKRPLVSCTWCSL
jgi:hypothetical protein